MAPLKFDEHIKDQLKDREIAPSKDAWNTIADRIEMSENQKKKSFFWYGIAASIVGLLMITAFYFTNTKDEIPVTTPYVDTPVKEIIKKDIETQEPAFKTQQETQVITATAEKEETYNAPLPKHMKTIEPQMEIAVVDNEELTTKSTDSAAVVLKGVKEQLIQDKIIEVVAQVQELEYTNAELTDTEVDAILRRAQEELLNDKIFKSDNSVDASALLAEAEVELDRTFRNQLFDALKGGYLKVRTAVADRNN